MSVEEIQQKIESSYSRPIRLEKTKKKRTETLQEFLISFFTKWNMEKNTVYADDSEVQTVPGKRRSLGDIFMICKYYYPDLELKELLYELYIALRQHFSKGFRTSYCNMINKRVWYYDENRKNLFWDQLKYDEFGNPTRFYLGLFAEAPEPQEDEEIDSSDDDYDEDDDDDFYCDCGCMD